MCIWRWYKDDTPLPIVPMTEETITHKYENIDWSLPKLKEIPGYKHCWICGKTSSSLVCNICGNNVNRPKPNK